jgi:uncharacterized protein (DUF952 family)
VIYHLARLPDWEQALRSGSYEVSTRGRTLAQEGFLHCSRRDQVLRVLHAYYADEPAPLVLLCLDPARTSSPVREDPVGDDTYPHVYGPIVPADVLAVVPVRRDAAALPAELPG